MISRKPAQDVLGLLNAGASVEVDAMACEPAQLVAFTHAVKQGCILVIHNSELLDAVSAQGVASAGKNRVVLA